MKQKLIATLCCSVICCAIYAQNGWFPAVSFPGNTNICDASSWKLVFADEFNGTSLSSPWITFYSWDGMTRQENGQTIYGDHEYWDQSRCAKPFNSIDKVSNIVISNGTCKLMVKEEPSITWTYPGGPTTTKNLSSAIIALPYRQAPTNKDYNFNNGRFEAKIKFPKKNGTWCNFWLWQGAGVNEIDIAEARSGDGQWESWLTGNRDHVAYATHAFVPDNNPYGISSETQLGDNYPNQSWWDYLWGNNMDINVWHVYTCEWDTTSVKFFLNNSLIETAWKYYQRKKIGPFYFNVGSGCQPAYGIWEVTKGFPWNPTSECQVRLTAGFKESETGYSSGNVEDRGEMEIDYVKIWQRHPEQDGHESICADNTYPATPTISGPNEVCGQVSYTLSPATTGTWSTFNSDILAVGATTASGADVAKDAGGAFNLGWVAFSYGNGIPECPLKTVRKNGLYCNHSTNWDIMVPTVLNNNGEARVHFISDLYYKRDVSGGTTPVVTWNVSINLDQDSYDEKTVQKYTLYGQYASTPTFTALRSGSYNIQWTMNVTDASGTWSRSGERNSKTALYQQEEDEHTYYVNAYIDDQDSYDETVYNSVAAGMVSEEEYNDTLYMDEMIEKIKAEALEPYIIADDSKSSGNASSGLDKPANENHISTALKSKLKIYPNPVQSNITIIADTRFTDKQTIAINVYDLVGKLVKSSKLDYRKGSIMTYDLSDVADGNYILELQQGAINEHIKITKAKS